MHKVLASALPLCCDSVCVCLLICLLQAEESLIGLCKAVVLHHKQSLEEVVIGGSDLRWSEGGISLDPLVPALLTCLKLVVLKLGPGTLSHAHTLTVLEQLPTLQELVLRGVSIGERSCVNTLTVLEKLPILQELVLRGVSIGGNLRQERPMDEVCLNTIL